MFNLNITNNNTNDPWHHLDAQSWVQKQIEWGWNHISGLSLLPQLQTLSGELVGCELGVCLGFTSELFKKNIPNLKKYYAVDNYPTYIDWNGGNLNKERQDLIKQFAYDKLSPLGVDLVYKSSDVFSQTIPDNYLDFIFIDGDHSYDGALKDFNNFYKKVKIGGIFAGHDYNNKEVNRAIKDFVKSDYESIITLNDNVWYKIKI